MASAMPDGAALTGEIDPEPGMGGNLPMLAGGGGFDDFGIGDMDTDADADPVDRLRRLIGQRREETVEILRNWLDDSEEVR